MQRIFVKQGLGGKVETRGDLPVMTSIFTKVIVDDVVERIPKGKKKGILYDATPRPEIPDCSDVDINGYGLMDVKVLWCTEDFKSQTMSKEGVYTMDTYPRGAALILSNTTFTTLPHREGANVDVTNITNLFDGLSFVTHIVQDMTAQGMKDELQKFSQCREHADRDCCVVVLMTHGKEGHIYGTDGRTVPLQTIFSMFDDDSCPQLSGKPKLFFIQACQGDKLRRQAFKSSATLDTEIGGSATADSSDTPVPPVWKTDMFIAFASPLGYAAVRNETGSPFLGAITKVFSEHAKNTSLLDMMTMVNTDVSENSKGLVQPEIHSTLRKQVYFFPGVGQEPKSQSAPSVIISRLLRRQAELLRRSRSMLIWATVVMMMMVFLATFLAKAPVADHEMHSNIPVAPLTIHSYVVSTEGRVIKEAGGVELIFPKDCVSEERVITVEVDVIPINDLINQKFMALSTVLTVKQSRNTPFLQPVTVTLPWMWRKYASKPQVNTTLMHFQPNRGWSVFSAHLQETDHTVTFKTFHFQSYFLVQTLHDAVYFVEKIWKGYAEDKVHLSIIPNATTREITMLCTHKLQDQQEFFFMSEEQMKHQFKQQVYMKSNEKIKAMITEESDIEIEKYDIPRHGITFYFPPATANRYSLRLKTKEGVSKKGEYEGSIQFDRVQADGQTAESTMEEAINNALIYLRPRSQVMAHTDDSIPGLGSVPAYKGPNDVVQYFEKVVQGVGTSWKELALKLGLSYEAVQVIDQNVKLKDAFDKCRDALHQWRQNKGKKATLEVLKDVLSQIGMKSVKDEL